MTEIFLTRSEVAAKLKVSERTLVNWQATGKLKGEKVGRTVRYTESGINEKFKNQNQKKNG